MSSCNNLILHCMDFRLQQPIENWIKDNNLAGDIDRISIGGPCKDHDLAMKFISICVEKHGVKNVYISQHEDCAGYGGHAAFDSLDKERRCITDDMSGLKEKIESKYPDVNVRCLIMEETGSDWNIVDIDV